MFPSHPVQLCAFSCVKLAYAVQPTSSTSASRGSEDSAKIMAPVGEVPGRSISSWERPFVCFHVGGRVDPKQPLFKLSGESLPPSAKQSLVFSCRRSSDPHSQTRPPKTVVKVGKKG